MIYPVTDSTGSYASRKTLATGYLLTLEKIDWYTANYLPPDIDRKHPYHSPVWSDNLTNLPPALVITAEYDPLRDEGEAYARQLEKAGVPVTYRMYEGMIHGFFELPRLLPTAQRAMKDVITTLQLAFSKKEGDASP
jgi:acetyl esterase